MSSARDTYVAHQELIERAIQFTCRRHHVYAADAEDFASIARLHLLDDDCAVIRAFKGRSSFQTYVVTVLTRCFLDWRNGRWGKWRPSVAAKRMGPLAVRLETLLARDRMKLDDAYEALRTNFGVSESRDALAAMAARFPQRTRRGFVSDAGLDEQPAIGAAADGPLRREEAAAAAGQAARVLTDVIAQLPPQDRLILRLRFEDDFSVSDIARALTLEQKALYRRISKLLSALRRELEAHGITSAGAAEILDQRAFDLVDGNSETAKTPGDVRPLYEDGSSPAQDSRLQ